MGLLSDNPVLGREIRGRLRLKHRGGGRVFPWVGAVLGVVIVYFYARGLIGLWRAPVQDASGFWEVLAYGLLALIVLLAPALSSTAITTEREQQTWESLATTRLSGTEILLGKWLGRQLIPWFLIVVAVPFLVGCALKADMSLAALPALLLFLLVTTAFYSVLGLLCSYSAKRTVAATATALTLTALFCIGTVVINMVLQMLFQIQIGGPTDTPVMWLNPFYALSALLRLMNPSRLWGSNGGQEDFTTVVWFYLILTIVLTAGAFALMVGRYRRAAREGA